MLIEINSMSAVSWNAWVAELRAQAEAMAELDNQTLARQLILWAAKRLASDSNTMTAQTMILLLNEIDQFRATGWLYSKERRGPCSSVRGAYNEFVRFGRQGDADAIAHSYTNLQGEYAYGERRNREAENGKLVYSDFENTKNDQLRELFAEWRIRLVEGLGLSCGEVNSAFVEDGFYPAFFDQHPRILFMGREGRGLSDCYTYTGCLFQWYHDGVLNGKTLESSRFHSLICYLAYAFKQYWSSGKFPEWEDIPNAMEIGKTLGSAKGISFAFMNLSKISNDSACFKTDFSTLAQFLDISAKGDFVGREIDILDPTLIITMNFSQYFPAAGIHIVDDENHPLKFDPNHDVCFQYARIRGKIRPLLDMWHFSAWVKGMKDNYYNPLVTIAHELDMRNLCATSNNF